MKLCRAMALLCGWLVGACDAVPDLYVVDASVDDVAEAGTEAATGMGDAGQDTGPEACVAVSCPDCPPNPGTCCLGGVACMGNNCATDCTACSACAPGDVCCSKQGGPPLCRNADAGKCPP